MTTITDDVSPLLAADCNSLLRATEPSYELYASAARLLWGEAGEIAAAEFERLNREHFAGSIPPMPILVGLTPYGGCIGLTRAADWLDAPRISLAPEVFRGSHRTTGGRLQVADVLIHEMSHAALILRGENSQHNAVPWCRLISDLSPAVLGHDIAARPVRTGRVPNPERDVNPKAPKTVVRRMPDPGCISQRALATWPHALRPRGYYHGDRPVYVPSC